jgi:hypothetical protein
MPSIATPPHAGLFDRRRPSREPSGVGVHLRATLHRSSLTEQLSEGADPASSAELAIRARRLVSARERRMLARTLQRTVEEARQPRVNLFGITPVCRREVLAAEEPMRVMIDRLRDSRPVAAEGMALIERIITDGTWSPLYNLTTPGALRRLTVLSTAALEPGLSA